MLDQLTARAFRALSAARGKRVFHPDGAAFLARFEPEPHPEVLRGSPLLRSEHRAIVRFSRGVGLPRGAPDILGVAVKILDVHGPGHDQDLALASSGRSALLRRMLVPHRDFADTVFSSILPYQAAARRVVVMAGAPIETLDMPLDRLAHAASAPWTCVCESSPATRRWGGCGWDKGCQPGRAPTCASTPGTPGRSSAPSGC